MREELGKYANEYRPVLQLILHQPFTESEEKIGISFIDEVKLVRLLVGG